MLPCFVLGLVIRHLKEAARSAALTAAKAPVEPREPAARFRPDPRGDRRQWRCWACFDRRQWRCWICFDRRQCRCCLCFRRRLAQRFSAPRFRPRSSSRPIDRTGPSGTSLGLGPRASCGPLQPGDDVPAGVNQGDPSEQSGSGGTNRCFDRRSLSLFKCLDRCSWRCCRASSWAW